MKLVNENLFEFHKGNDPMTSLGLGTSDEDINKVISKEILQNHGVINTEFSGLNSAAIIDVANLIYHEDYNITEAIAESYAISKWWRIFTAQKAFTKYRTLLYVLYNEFGYRFDYETYIKMAHE